MKAVALLTNVPFLNIPSSSPPAFVQPHPDVTFEEIHTALREADGASDVFSNPSKVLELDASPAASSDAKVDSPVVSLFYPQCSIYRAYISIHIFAMSFYTTFAFQSLGTTTFPVLQ